MGIYALLHWMSEVRVSSRSSSARVHRQLELMDAGSL